MCRSTTPLINKTQNLRLRQVDFAWQEGYGVFSVGKPAMEVVSNYVTNQERHHSGSCGSLSLEQEWDRIVDGNYEL